MATGILCHGRHLQATNWKLHQFGIPERGLGQILKTCQLAEQKKPKVIVFGTGASEKEGVKEAEYIIKYMINHFGELALFPQFSETNIDKLKEYMISHSIPEITSQNTYEEITKASEIFERENVEEVILVSNPDHISRCFQLAYKFAQDKKLPFYFLAAQSDIGYNGGTEVTSKIIEAPHRGDDPSPNLAGVIGEYFRLDQNRKKEFVDMVAEYLKGF